MDKPVAKTAQQSHTSNETPRFEEQFDSLCSLIDPDNINDELNFRKFSSQYPIAAAELYQRYQRSLDSTISKQELRQHFENAGVMDSEKLIEVKQKVKEKMSILESHKIPQVLVVYGVVGEYSDMDGDYYLCGNQYNGMPTWTKMGIWAIRFETLDNGLCWTILRNSQAIARLPEAVELPTLITKGIWEVHWADGWKLNVDLRVVATMKDDDDFDDEDIELFMEDSTNKIAELEQALENERKKNASLASKLSEMELEIKKPQARVKQAEEQIETQVEIIKDLEESLQKQTKRANQLKNELHSERRLKRQLEKNIQHQQQEHEESLARFQEQRRSERDKLEKDIADLNQQIATRQRNVRSTILRLETRNAVIVEQKFSLIESTSMEIARLSAILKKHQIVE